MQNVIIRGGGDLASGVAIRLKRCGFNIIITELEKPLSVRRKVSFSEAVYDGFIEIEGLVGRLVLNPKKAVEQMYGSEIPILIDPELEILSFNQFHALTDSRITKTKQQYVLKKDLLVLGLGPGFTAGNNCHAAIETQRGHTLGRVFWEGSTIEDTGLPEGNPKRVFRAPRDGKVSVLTDIGTMVTQGEPMATVGETAVLAPISGVIRGMIRDGSWIQAGVKLGDVDSRNIRSYCYSVSDKAFAVAGGVLEALLVHQNRTKDE